MVVYGIYYVEADELSDAACVEGGFRSSWEAEVRAKSLYGAEWNLHVTVCEQPQREDEDDEDYTEGMAEIAAEEAAAERHYERMMAGEECPVPDDEIPF